MPDTTPEPTPDAAVVTIPVLGTIDSATGRITWTPAAPEAERDTLEA